MKKLINKSENLVVEMGRGFVLAHPNLSFLERFKIISRTQLASNKVAIISGGGSGHEPSHAGFVGNGMLDAAICGDVFASPSQIQVYQGIKHVSQNNNKGVLMIVKNYSGDIMNFGNGAAPAIEDGINVDYVKVDDDIAVQNSLYTVGRRGVAGVVFVHKIAGAAAEMGMELSEIKSIAQKAANNVRSIGFAFSSCTVPAKQTPTFELAADEMEYGVGIHGEPGVRREKVLSSQQMAERMVNELLQNLDPNCKEVAVLINGFGSTPLHELYVFNNDVINVLVTRGITIHRTFVGNYMTSIDMAGASLSLLNVNGLEEYLNAPANTPALVINGPLPPITTTTTTTITNTTSEDVSNISKTPIFAVETTKEYGIIHNEQFTLNNFIYYIDKMSAIIIENEIPFCDLDSHAGDGDFGSSLAKGFKQIKCEWQWLITASTTISDFLHNISMIIMEHCGGASGPIWGSAFRAASKSTQNKEVLNVKDFATMLEASVKGIQSTSQRSFGHAAVVGDKTLIDALIPCVDEWIKLSNEMKTFKECFTKGADAAVAGAEATKSIAARMGRAGNVGERSIGHPDAGAFGLGVIFTALANDMESMQ